jgi:squalene-hopene/tetraprenyl-beta-curcumene cyclase
MTGRGRRYGWLCAAAFVVAGCGDGGQGSAAAGTPGSGASAAQAPTPGGAPSTRPDAPPPGTATWKDRTKASIDRGIRFLRDQQSPDMKWGFRTPDGKFRPDVGITALILLGMLESHRGYSEQDGPFMRDALAWLATNQKPDGSIHGGMLATYNTAVSMLALSASKNPAYRPTLDKALEYLRVVQSDESERYERSDVYYGGVGYGGDERPDLSNTHFAVEAAATAGMPADDAFFKKSLVFLQRSQNASETNDLPVSPDGVGVGNDGGGFYSPGSTAGEAKAGFVTLPDGKKIRRSYGSMSYALLKSYAFCKIDRRDPRVRALVDWLNKNYELKHNPGMQGEKPNAEFAGLFYYYLTMARALRAAGDVLTLPDGSPRPWKQELAETIIALQKEDGAWVNEKNGEFWENVPILGTAYAVATLNLCLK